MDMKQSLEKLLKYMRLEADRGFDNRAIVGGLKKMLEPWQEEARSEGVSDAFIEVVVSRLDDYAHLSPRSRREALQGIIVRMRKELPEGETIEVLPKLDSPSASASTASEKMPTKTEQLPVATTEENAESSTVLSKPTEPEDQEMSTIPTTKAAESAESREDESPPPSEEEESLEALEAPLTTIQGIGPKSAKTLAKLGLETLGDLLWYLPRRYDDYSQLETINRLWYGQEVTVIGAVESIDLRVVRSGKMKITEAIVSDGTGSLRVMDRKTIKTWQAYRPLGKSRSIPWQAYDEQSRLGTNRASAAPYESHRSGISIDIGSDKQVVAQGNSFRRYSVCPQAS